MQKSSGFGSAPGKIILTGEHSVVYGFPAIAIAINLRCNVRAIQDSTGLTIFSEDLGETFTYTLEEINRIKKGESINKVDNIAFAAFQTVNKIGVPLGLKLEIASQIPISAGLGSSAAVVVSTIASILDLYTYELDKPEISAIAYESEKITHGNPSGIDNSIATFGGFLRFEDKNLVQKEIEINMPIIVCNTQVPRDTKTLVAGVQERMNQFPNIIDPVLDQMGKITDEAEISLFKGDLKRLGKLFDINQGLLDSIGVGHATLSEIIWKCRELGSIGTKLTGAGGGGCMFAIVETEQRATDITNSLKELGYHAFQTSLSSKGVIIGGITS